MSKNDHVRFDLIDFGICGAYNLLKNTVRIRMQVHSRHIHYHRHNGVADFLAKFIVIGNGPKKNRFVGTIVFDNRKVKKID